MVMVMVVVVVVVVAVCVWVVVVAVCVWVEGGNAPQIHSSCRKRVLHLFSTGLIEGRSITKRVYTSLGVVRPSMGTPS